MTEEQLDFYKRLAHALALQFGSSCEVVVHDLETKDPSHSIVAIENGHVTGRKLGDGPSHVVLEALHAGDTKLEDRPAYLTKTADGKIVLADEISPDTCRLWDKTTKEKLDKDRFRRDMGGVEEAYQEIMKRVMGK